MKQYYIGIDCGTKTGMCVYDAETKKIMRLVSGNIIEMIYDFQLHVGTWEIGYDELKFRIEDARLRTWIPYQKNEKAERGRREGAGYVKAHAAIWEDFCKYFCISYELVAPKNNKTKVTPHYFKILTNYQQSTNEHERDAAMLVIGH
jgi:hypothetical protein